MAFLNPTSLFNVYLFVKLELLNYIFRFLNHSLYFLNFSIVYETDTDHITSKDSKNGVFFPVPTKHKKLNSDKNFENVNFKPYTQEEVDSKLPLQMNDPIGDTIVDEYPGGEDDDSFDDDRTPIIPRFV